MALGSKEQRMENTGTILSCISVAYIAGGILLLLFPQVSLANIWTGLGLVLIVAGVVLISAYFLRKRYLTPGHFGFAGGAACVLLGIFSLLRTSDVAFAFSQFLALLVLADSLLKLQYSTDLLRLCQQRWWLVLAAAAVGSTLAMIALVNPFGQEQARLQFTYAALITDGALNIASLLYLNHARRIFQNRLAGKVNDDTDELNAEEIRNAQAAAQPDKHSQP